MSRRAGVVGGSALSNPWLIVFFLLQAFVWFELGKHFQATQSVGLAPDQDEGPSDRLPSVTRAAVAGVGAAGGQQPVLPSAPLQAATPQVASPPIVARPALTEGGASEETASAGASKASSGQNPSASAKAEYPPGVQSIHWIFTTDCSVYMWNQGNLLLNSALRVGQVGKFTWIMVGCQRKEQQEETKKLVHPRATVFHTPNPDLIHPDTGKPVKQFQASNRPAGIDAWWRAVRDGFEEEAIAILDPDEAFLRPVVLIDNPNVRVARGPWQTYKVKPKMSNSALYGIGCIPRRFSEDKVRVICGKGKRGDKCIQAMKDNQKCFDSYASGPPWVIHRDDCDDVFSVWTDTAVRVNDIWPDLFAEQSAFGISQMQFDVKSRNDAFWFLASPDDPYMQRLWDDVVASGYDPCKEREPPSPDLRLPLLWHSCLSYNIEHLGREYNLHKDHVHKDLLDCSAPLLRHPPKDALGAYNQVKSKGWRMTFAVCIYTNIINQYAGDYKRKFCDEPNLETTYKYPAHSNGFIDQSNRLAKIFRRGGWQDVDYKVGQRR
eukprot:TRINITY_DN47471_c0_g1_i1.p1 TRINITY_DN47471_c0_g1~~TRINITY_DN47471_c0_g1_i1.p1  ORF type:complete len:548 (-),score=74.02 TRINITY_DN47471_c0_g1_i1:100-1743(-)